MKDTGFRLCSVFMVILACGISSLASASLADDFQRKNGRIHVLRTAEKAAKDPKKLELNRNSIDFDEDGDGEPEKVPVVLVRTSYKCTQLKVTEDGDIDEGAGAFICYELRSRSALGTFSWTLCTYGVVGHIRLVGSDDGELYMAWIEAGDILYSKIDAVKDSISAVTEMYQIEKYPLPLMVCVPVHEVIGEEPFSGPDARYSDIFVESIEESKDGTVTVKFKGHDKDKLYTLVREKGGEWHVPEKKVIFALLAILAIIAAIVFLIRKKTLVK